MGKSIDSEKMKKWMADNKKVPPSQMAQIESAIGMMMMSVLMTGGDLSESSLKKTVENLRGNSKTTEDDIKRYTRASQLIVEYVEYERSKPWWKFW